MFGVDDFAVWFAWYFVSNIATHPTTHRAVENAQIAIVGADAPIVLVDDPDRLLDWLVEDGRAQPYALGGGKAASGALSKTLSGK